MAWQTACAALQTYKPLHKTRKQKKIGLTKRALADSQDGVLDKPRGNITEEESPNTWFDRTVPTQRDGEIKKCSFHHAYNPVNKRVGTKIIHSMQATELLYKGISNLAKERKEIYKAPPH